MEPGLHSPPELGGVGGSGGPTDESEAAERGLGAGSGALQLRIEAAGVAGGHAPHRRRRGVVPVEGGGGGGAGGGGPEPGELVADSGGDGENGVVLGVGWRGSRSDAADHDGIVLHLQCDLHEVLRMDEIVEENRQHSLSGAAAAAAVAVIVVEAAAVVGVG